MHQVSIRDRHQDTDNREEIPSDLCRLEADLENQKVDEKYEQRHGRLHDRNIDRRSVLHSGIERGVKPCKTKTAHQQQIDPSRTKRCPVFS